MISMAMLHDAQRVLKPVINRTPVIPTKGLVPGCDFYLKADCLQKTGAFKLRGAYYKIATLSDEEKARGVIACSAGNHAQGVAYAARDMGIKATICIPEGAPISKIEATRSYGANVVLVPGVYDDAYAEAVRLRDEQGLTFIHPFNDYRIMAGQGTIGLEILEDVPNVTDVVVGTEYVYHDAYCGDECEYGQIIGMPAKFQAPKELVEKALAAGGDTPVHGGLIVSGEWFVDSKEKMGGILEHFPNAKAVDMESCSIAQTCHIYHVPFISFRIISDIPLKDNKASQYFDFWARLAEGSFNVTKHFLQSI